MDSISIAQMHNSIERWKLNKYVLVQY